MNDNEEFEEIKDIGQVSCPQCKAIINIKKRVVYDQAEPRHVKTKELFAEKSIQTTLPVET